ncbi:MAG: PIN domain-containing protein [Akkermansiaceae bacterium]
MTTLIDSSAWIPVLRPKGEKSLREEVEQLLADGHAAITAPVWCELYRGVRGKSEEAQLANLRSLCQWLDFDAACWELAAKHGRACQTKGVNVPTSDLLIHCCAERHKAQLLHRDRHFELIAKAVK